MLFFLSKVLINFNSSVLLGLQFGYLYDWLFQTFLWG